MTDEKLYLVWLTSRAATGSALPYLLLKYFGTARAVYEATEADLADAPVEWRGRLRSFCDKDLGFATGVLEYCEENGVGLSSAFDPFYPKRLFDLSNPPLLLYHVGEFCDLDNLPTVSVVGAREPSAYGERAAKRLSVDLARGGAVLVSGMARGIDGLAHRAALYCEAPTVAVLGAGIDRVYPPEHRDLMAQVAQSGLVLTEYAPGTPPNAKNFPMRNRLLAALCRITLVVEASASSGALITAEQALRLGRGLYTVPSSIFSAACAGSNHLLRCGAKCALTAEDLLLELARDFPQAVTAPSAPKPVKRRAPRVRPDTYHFPGSAKTALPAQYDKQPNKTVVKTRKKRVEKCTVLELTADERELLARLSFEPKPVEALADGTLSASALLSLLTSLELKGYIERISGNRFLLVDDA